MRTALTVAGSDSGGGAGIQADLKTFAAHGVFGTCAITAITAQNTLGVTRVEPLSADLVTDQIKAVISDIGADAAKTGMLASATIVEAVGAAVEDLRIPSLVVDPVIVASSGKLLLSDDALAALRTALLRRAFLVTPNIPEAETLSGLTIRTRADIQEAGRRIVALGASAVVITGGHFPSPNIVDVLYDGHRFTEFATERLHTRHSHGTGCTYSAALTSQLALGLSPGEAIPLAQQYVAGAIRNAPDVGRGEGPLDQFWQLRP